MENDTYTILVDPDSSNTFLGAPVVSKVFNIIRSKTKASSDKIRSWLRLPSNKEPPGEQQALMGDYFDQHPSAENSDTDSLTSNLASRHPALRHYSTLSRPFPPRISASSARTIQNRENILFKCFISSFLTSLMCFIAVVVLVSIREKSNEDMTGLGAIVGMVLSVVFAAAGTGVMFLMRDVLWVFRGLVCVVFAMAVVVNGFIGLMLTADIGTDRLLGRLV